MPIFDSNNSVDDGVVVNTDKMKIKIVNCDTSGGCGRSWRRCSLPFQIFTTLLLSLLLPLSFLLLARLSAAHYLSFLSNSHQQYSYSNLNPLSNYKYKIASFLFLYNAKSIVLYALVSFVAVAALVHGLTHSRLTLVSRIPQQPSTTKLYLAWIMLCTFQVCVGLGIEGSISAGIDGSGFNNNNNSNHFLLIVTIKALLLVGLHETMSFWSRNVVKPVVVDTVGGINLGAAGSYKEEEGEKGRRIGVMVEKVGVALSLGALWWWRLRDEVDALVAVPELIISSQPAGIRGLGLTEFGGWWLFYLTVSIGTMRVLKSGIWAVGVVRRRSSDSFAQQHHQLLPLEEDMV